MMYKKTLTLNVFFAIILVFLYLLGYAIDIDYIEKTTSDKIIIALEQICYLSIPVVSAIHFYKPNCLLMRKLSLFGNYGGVLCNTFYLILLFYVNTSLLMDKEFFIIIFVYALFTLPFVINLKALRS